MFKRQSGSSTIIALALAFGVSACTQDPATGQQRMNTAGSGAIIGALGGAALGALTGDDGVERRQRALIGAGIGALAGGGIGAYMNRQEQQLRQELADTPVEVVREAETIILTVPSEVTFQSDTARLLPAAQGSLNEVADVLTRNPQTTLDVIGHTDSTGEDAYNLRLSEDRARAVATYLTGRGVQAERILIAGRGEREPVASNATPEGRAMNRRVEIRINPLQAPGA